MSKKRVPAVFFQKELNGPAQPSTKPERLELFEKELMAVAGGMLRAGGAYTSCRTDTACVINCVCQLDDSAD